MPLLLCTTLHGALTTDGCYTQRVLLRQNQCVRTTTSVPLAQKTRPRLASWAAHFRLPASGLSPWWHGDSWVGARWPTLSLVLPSVLGVPSPQCLLEVPSLTHTYPCASGSDLLGSKHLSCPVVVPARSRPLLPPPSWDGFLARASCLCTERKGCLQRPPCPWVSLAFPGLSAGFYPGDLEEGQLLGRPYLASGFSGQGLTTETSL